MYEKIIESLNKEQKNIIKDTKNSIYVLAGAGTGKTKTLTSKIIFLLKKLKIDQKKILAITFTNNAAQEMKKRLKKILNEDCSELNIETFHSLSNKILKKKENEKKLKFSFNIIDEKDSKIIIKEKIKKLKLKNNIINSINQIRNFISYYKTQIIRNEIIKKINIDKKVNNVNKKIFFNDEKEFKQNYQELEKIYLEYKYFLIKNNLMDFDDLIINNYKLLKDNNLVLKFYQNKFSHILVDEFQDIDIIQYQIIKMIGKNSILFVVGDPNQNIYNFRGSDIICSDLFLKDFKAIIYRLFKNYRSTKNILSKSNLLIENNYENEKKFKNKLESIIGQGDEVIYKKFPYSYLESKFIIEEIKKLINKEKYNYGDFAILYRINELSKDIENSLITNNIPYNIQGYISFYNKKEIKVFINYLNALIYPEKDFYLKKIINIPSRKIGKKTLEKLDQISLEKKISLIENIKNEVNNKTKIGKKITNFQKIFKEISDSLKDKNKCNLSNIIFVIDKIIGYTDSLNNNYHSKDNEKIKNKELKKNLTRLQNIFHEFEFPQEIKDNFSNTYDKISFILEQISLFYDSDNQKNKDKVILSSIHKSKGLEYKIVFFIGLEEKVFLSNRENFFEININKNNIIEKIKEERRLVYVAITRAKKILYITSSQNRFLFGKKIISNPICFIKEMRLKNFAEKTKKLKNKFYKIADNIIHNKFGIGKIITIKKDIITISFSPPYGIKDILINHHSLKKYDK
ncbi:ATP-dependent helicase [Candidatus Phytoplasma sacchari]|uniref:DNA 3'-5' helicase n=1 Tax=Candidatus Phytoplasma sacchari TaxID=2609813 RepID=A0ABY7M2G1_9MOLU|nr:UvrD-helicase domain-containing protein [Candidatus Phytoplasma sacchari]